MNEMEKTLKLIDAGFTAEEIRNMAKAPEAEAEEEAAKAGDVNPPIGAAEDKGAPESTAAETSEEAKAWLKNITKELDDHIAKLKEAYQNYNIIQQSNQPPKTQETGVQALASLVAPSAIYQKGENE